MPESHSKSKTSGSKRKLTNQRPELSNKQKARLAALATMPDSEIDTSDIPEDTDWSTAQRGKFLIQGKARIKVQKEKQIS